MGGILVGLVVLWFTTAMGMVSRPEMQNYVEVTATEHLRLLREDIRAMNSSLCERLAEVEAVIRER